MYASTNKLSHIFTEHVHSSLFQEITENIDVEVGTLIFNNGLPFGTCESRDLYYIILKANKVSRAYKIISWETIKGPILDEFYATMRDRQTRNLLN